MDPVDSKFVMQVRAGTEASGAYVTDYLTLRDGTAASNISGKAGQMCVERNVFLPVLKSDHFSILMFSADKSHQAICRRHDRVASASTVIHSFVGTPFF